MHVNQEDLLSPSLLVCSISQPIDRVARRMLIFVSVAANREGGTTEKCNEVAIIVVDLDQHSTTIITSREANFFLEPIMAISKGVLVLTFTFYTVPAPNES